MIIIDQYNVTYLRSHSKADLKAIGIVLLKSVSRRRLRRRPRTPPPLPHIPIPPRPLPRRTRLQMGAQLLERLHRRERLAQLRLLQCELLLQGPVGALPRGELALEAGRLPPQLLATTLELVHYTRLDQKQK